MANFLPEDARQVLDNKAFKIVFTRMAEHIEARALACDPDNREQAQRIIISKQILTGIKREFERILMDGEVEKIKLAEIEKRSTISRVLRR